MVHWLLYKKKVLPFLVYKYEDHLIFSLQCIPWSSQATQRSRVIVFASKSEFFSIQGCGFLARFIFNFSLSNKICILLYGSWWLQIVRRKILRSYLTAMTVSSTLLFGRCDLGWQLLVILFSFTFAVNILVNVEVLRLI